MGLAWRVRSRCVAAALVALASALPACAGRRERELRPGFCEFVVYNRTSFALEVRMRNRPYTATWLGSLNPTELLSETVPCSLRQVSIVGVGLRQVGLAGPYVHGWAELVEGERVEITLDSFSGYPMRIGRL